MSLPVTRRIARAALLVAVGAAPVVGAAGSASAAALPQPTDLGSMSTLDGAAVGGTLDSGARQTTEVAGDLGGKAVKKGVPAAGKTVGTVGRTATPAVQKLAGDAAGTAGEVVGDTTSTATKTAGSAPAGSAGSLVGGLPVGMPIGR
ncbi:hypothetical protein [Streptomyces odonnellii]|uniref:hypothetical protein n=1 Tax=Streptomyces odonnellii TaxID=1417980 RepID=UPI0006258B43|nr:hypothetical protein [Streptomyces odonnellii]